MSAISRAVATLRVRGDELSPGEITRLLGSEPTCAYSKGDVLLRPKGRVAKFGMWRLEATPLEPSDFNTQVASLLDQLTQDMHIWQELTERYDVSLFCGWFMRESNEGEDLSPKTLISLGQRGLSLGLDIYAPDDE